MSNALVKRDKTIPETAVQRCFRKRCSENMQQTYRGTPMPKCDFNKVEKSRTSAWVFSSKFAAYFQNIFSLDHLWTAASTIPNFLVRKVSSEFCKNS